MLSLLQASEYWRGLGVDLIPCQPKSKLIVAGFGPRRKQITSAADALLWFAERSANLAVVCGSGCLVVADFDHVGQFTAWRAGAGADVHTRIERTPQGFHVFFRTKRQLPALSVRPGLELKASGAVLAAPSLYTSGKPYTVECDCDPLWIADPAELFLLPEPSPPREGTQRHRPRGAPKSATSGLVQSIKAAVSVEELASGRTLLKRSSQDGRWLIGHCPFHPDAHPSFWIDTERNLWGCYSPDCPSNQNGHTVHDVINFYALSIGATQSRAIRLLANRIGARSERGV